jgi:hypothetical protein
MQVTLPNARRHAQSRCGTPATAKHLPPKNGNELISAMWTIYSPPTPIAEPQYCNAVNMQAPQDAGPVPSDSSGMRRSTLFFA